MKKSNLLNETKFFLKSHNVDVLFTVFILLVSLYFYFFLSLSSVPTSDGAEYLNNARGWSTGSQLTGPFRAPLISWIIAGIWAITGENWIIIKYLLPAFTLAAGILLYLVLRKHKGGWFALGVSALTMLNPQVFFWGTYIMTEGLSLFFLVLSLYFMKSEKQSYWYLGGISIGLTFASRYPIILPALTIFVVESIIRRNPRFVTRIITTLLPIMVLVVLAVYLKNGWFSVAESEQHVQFSFLLSSYYSINSINIWGYAFLLVPIAFLFRRTYTDKYNYTFIAWFIVSLVFWSANAHAPEDRYTVQFAPAVYYLAILGMENITKINITQKSISGALNRFIGRSK